MRSFTKILGAAPRSTNEWSASLSSLQWRNCMKSYCKFCRDGTLHHGCADKKVENSRGSYFLNLDDVEFCQLTRTTRASFDYVCDVLGRHRVFHNDSKNPQAPMWLQLAVALDRLGTNGNGASEGRRNKNFIDSTTFRWPKNQLSMAYVFYRTYRYSVNGQAHGLSRGVVVKKWIQGSFISPNQYLLANYAYPTNKTHNTLVPAYKKNDAGIDNEDFNTCVAHARIVHEHNY
ncbi:hypothetical protein PHMEG_0008450 [Phytophthora megakarya]|uniref:Uncharacterized protein n=1 Tax=Phytophthora megakarya TaxID=4795 RepID=A0A225WKS5_9STRA|nr:hypothetical protein PHMEG_0008450 [Phytophthora megakarya]